jgi:ADP-ribose pyrophosphatase
MDSWKTLSRETVLDRGKFLRVEDHTVQLPDGRVIKQWPWVISPDFINVVAVTETGEFLCFHQVKYAVEGEVLATIGGYLEPGEEPLAAAKRELLEETGYEASEWIALGQYCVDANRGAGTAHYFLALHARHVADPTPTIWKSSTCCTSHAPRSSRAGCRTIRALLGSDCGTGAAACKDSLQSPTAG